MPAKEKVSPDNLSTIFAEETIKRSFKFISFK